MRGRFHYWLSPCRILWSTRICSWNFRLGLKMSGADLALGRAWRVGWLTVPLTGSAIVLDGMQLDTDRTLDLSRSVPDEFRELAEEDANSVLNSNYDACFQI